MSGSCHDARGRRRFGSGVIPHVVCVVLCDPVGGRYPRVQDFCKRHFPARSLLIGEIPCPEG